MKAMILGDSGKEHALATALASDPSVEKIYVLPGNFAMALDAKVQLLSVEAFDARNIIHQAQDLKVDLVILGPTASMAVGLGDVLRAANLIVLGPSQAAAQLGRDAIFTARFLQEQGILDLTMPGMRQDSSYTITALCDASAFKVVGVAGDYQFVRWRDREAFLAYGRDDFASAPPRQVLEELIQEKILRGLRQKGMIFNGLLSLKLQAWQGQWGVRQVQTWPQARELHLAFARHGQVAWGQYFAAAATNLLGPMPNLATSSCVAAHLAMVVDQALLAMLYQQSAALKQEQVYLSFSGHKPVANDKTAACRMLDLVAVAPTAEAAEQKLHKIFNQLYLENAAAISPMA